MLLSLFVIILKLLKFNKYTTRAEYHDDSAVVFLQLSEINDVDGNWTNDDFVRRLVKLRAD